MKLETSILIKANAVVVWEKLMNFEQYPLWNPFIREISGIPEIGKNIVITIGEDGEKPMKFSPIILKNEINTEFRWKGKLWMKGIFDGEHIFRLKSISDSETMFIHEELFSGILVPLLQKNLETKTKQGFIRMNEALKMISEA